MGKTWNYKSRSDRRGFVRSLHKGKTVYVIDTPQHAGHAALWNHAQTWTGWTVGGKHPFSREWYFGGDASNTAEGFLAWHGTVYEDQPRGIPHHSDPGPRVASPLRNGTYEMSLKEMEYEADQAKDRANGDLKAGRRSRTSWF
jgi:hypothetical protein